MERKEWWDESKEIFVETPPATLQLEHSLLSVSKWESKWKIPFLSNSEKTTEQTLDYIRCMTINRNVKPYVYSALSSADIGKILDYIADSHTATTIKRMGGKKGGGREIVTSELIYYWMILYGIPFECQKWNISRLLTLIEVCEAKQNPKKMGRNEILRSNAQLNAARRAKLHTKG